MVRDLRDARCCALCLNTLSSSALLLAPDSLLHAQPPMLSFSLLTLSVTRAAAIINSAPDTPPVRAKVLHDISDVERLLPGTLETIREWCAHTHHTHTHTQRTR